MVAGGGGGGAISSIGGNHWNGYPGQASESGRMVLICLKRLNRITTTRNTKPLTIFRAFRKRIKVPPPAAVVAALPGGIRAYTNNGSLYRYLSMINVLMFHSLTGDGYAQWTL